MARWADPRDLRLVIIILRSLKGWNQADVCRQTGIDPASMSRYESGEQAPSRKNLARIAAAVGAPVAFAEELIPVCRGIRHTYERAASRGDLEAADRDELDRKLAGAALQAAAPFLLELAEFNGGAPRASDRIWAAGQWEKMKDLPASERELIVDTLDDERIWALAERLGEASAEAAAHRADLALDLAQLALRAAGRLAEGRWRSLIEGLAWAFFANACRVGGNLPGARDAFSTSDRLWKAGVAGDPAGLLDSSRRMDLKASLLKNDGQFEEACALLDQAVFSSQSEATKARILIQKAALHASSGDCESAIGVLHQAEPRIDADQEPRLVCVLLYNRAIYLCRLDRFVEARELVPAVRELAVKLGNELDLVRVLGLEAKVKTGFRLYEEARADYEQARRYFEQHKIAYDFAIASLELSVSRSSKRSNEATPPRLANSPASTWNAWRLPAAARWPTFSAPSTPG